jgi:prephenate dehydrogenase
VDGASLVIISTPVLSVKSVLEVIAPVLRPGAIVTDTASTKQQVIQWAEQILPEGVHFIGGHPLTTQVGSGIDAARASLFAHRIYCLMPARLASQQALETMINLAQLVGARPYFLDPVEHDAFVAVAGHLPFLAATAFVRTATGSPSWPEIRRVAASEFENASLPLTSAPQTYADICQTNRDAILRWLDEYTGRIAELRALVEAGGPDLLAAFAAAQDARAQWMATRDDDLQATSSMAEVQDTGGQIRQLFLGNMAKESRLPGGKKN